MCEHHWHDEGIWEFCCECNAHKCEATHAVWELIKKYENFARELDPKFAPTQVFSGVAVELRKALDGEQ